MWWVLEIIIWYVFFYAAIFTVKHDVHIGWMAFVLLFLASLGIFASPMTRHLSVWNKILDKVIRKEEEKNKY